MHTHTYRRSFTLLALCAALCAAAAAADTSLTIYSRAEPGAVPADWYRPSAAGGAWRGAAVPGYAVVRQERTLEIERGRSTLEFTDVAALIDPTTVRFRSLTHPDGTRVLEQDYRFDLVGAAALMERYLDKTVTVHQGLGEDRRSVTGRLLSTRGGTILEGEDGRVHVLAGYTAVDFPELPGGLMTRPTLVWEVEARRGGRHETRVSYQTEGITWWADYNLVWEEGDDANEGTLDVGAWVSIVNQSGAGYIDAGLKLIAGDVHRAESGRYRDLARREVMRAAALEDRGFEEKSFFEFHLYTLGRKTSLPDNSTKQLELFPSAEGVPAVKRLVYYGTPGYVGMFASPQLDRNYGVQSNPKVDVYLEFDNDPDHGLGVPLPSGRVRVSQLDTADDTLEFIGEDVIDHTPRKQPVRIKLGSAFDVIGERRQLDFRVDTRAHWMEERIEVKITNRKEQPVAVTIKENLYRWLDWEITDASADYEKVDSRTIHIPVTVAADSERVVSYTVRYTW